MATIPSIAMIPSGYKAGKVYSVLPTNGDADLTFTRASEATRVDETGVIETMATGVPRLDYSDGGCPSLLVEPQSTNLLSRSEEFDNAYWTKQSGVTVFPNTVVSPDGQNTADTVSGASNIGWGGTNVITAQPNPILSSTTYTLSVYVKSLGSTTFQTSIRNNNVGGQTTVSHTIDNNWTRVTQTFTTTSTQTLIGIVFGGTNGDIAIWGAQIEALPYATSYIPTVAGTVTRVIETYSKTGLQNYINSTQGTFFIKCKSLTNETAVPTCNISLNDGTTNNRVVIAYTSNSEIYILLTVSGLQVYDAFLNTDLTQIHSIAISWSENNFLTYINGNLIEQQLTGATFPINTLNRISSSSGGVPFRSIPYIYNLQVFNTALSDAELQTLTTL